MSLSRRALLRTLGTGAASLPFFNLLRPSIAEAAEAPPLRFLAVFNPHGTINELWRPQRTESDFNLDYPGSILQPLTPYKSKTLILEGVDFRVLFEKKEIGHDGGLVSFLTGSRCVNLGADAVPENESLDQFLAARVGGQTKFRSLELGVYRAAGDSASSTMCFGPGGKRLPNQIDPQVVYRRLFADLLVQDPAEAERALRRKKSVLDFVLADLGRMRGRLAGPERAKLDQHLEAVREIERRLLAGPPPGCSAPAEPATLDPTAIENVPAVTRLMIDLLVQAFACDLTRVATLQQQWCGSVMPMPWLSGLNTDIHELVHRVRDEGPSGEAARANAGRVQRWYAEQFAYLLERLDAIPEGDGTLLDHTIILWGNELGDPALHYNLNVPLVLAGGGGKFRMGRALSYSQSEEPSCEWTDGCPPASRYGMQTAHNGLLVAIARAFGAEVDTFGDPDYRGELPHLR